MASNATAPSRNRASSRLWSLRCLRPWDEPDYAGQAALDGPPVLRLRAVAPDRRLPDDSCLSAIHPSERDRRQPAHELAALCHERREIETARDELKAHLRGFRVVLCSKTPGCVRQEFHGLMMAHFAIRSPDPQGGTESRRRTGPVRLPSRCARGASKVARRHPHFGRAMPFMTPSSTKSFSNVSSLAETGKTPAPSSAK